VTTWALVPLKSPARAKSRLSPLLDEKQRRDLHQRLANHVINQLQQCPHIDQVAVITSDAADFFQTLHNPPLLISQENELGTAAAFEFGLTKIPKNVRRVLLISADLPLLDLASLDALFTACNNVDLGIVPDRHNSGSNALLCRTPEKLIPAFGEASFAKHLAMAVTAGISHIIVRHPNLCFDLDTPDDFAQLPKNLSLLSNIIHEVA